MEAELRIGITTYIFMMFYRLQVAFGGEKKEQEDRESTGQLLGVLIPGLESHVCHHDRND